MKSIKFLDEIKKVNKLSNDKELAAFLGWSPTSISRYYSGKRIMENEQCLAVAKALQMDDPMPVYRAADMDRAEKTGQRSLWEVFTKATSLSHLAVALSIGVTLFMTTDANATNKSNGYNAEIERTTDYAKYDQSALQPTSSSFHQSNVIDGTHY